MPKEQPQSLENQLKMARPKRAEVKRVPLTPEEKDFLGKIMDQAVAAEKTGKLQEALNLYTDYKNELLRIKDKKEQEKKKKSDEGFDLNLPEEVLDWVHNEVGFSGQAAVNWIEKKFDRSAPLPHLKIKGDLRINPAVYDIKRLPNHLIVDGTLIIERNDFKYLPRNLVVNKDLHLVNANIKELPDDLKVVMNIFIKKTDTDLLDQAKKLEKKGQIGKVTQVK